MTLAELKPLCWLVMFLQLAFESLIFYIDNEIHMHSVSGKML